MDRWIFRGQHDASWPLSTLLQRVGQQTQGTSFSLSEIEKRILWEFLRRAHQFLPNPPELPNRLEWMALLQHFGGPTRLLDFTNSFYAAAFFAIESAQAECAIWCINHDALYDAAVSWLNLDEHKARFPYWESSTRMGQGLQGALLSGDGQSEAFVFEVQPFRLNERLAVQQGLFLCPLSVSIPFMQSLAARFGLPPSAFSESKTENYDPMIHTWEMLREAAVVKLLLPPEIQYDALADLWRMNVNAAALFPGLDGFARSLKHFARIDNLWNVKYLSSGFAQETSEG
jgi:hypothetical protein